MDDLHLDPERQLDRSALYWVGIGASAGGLEALRELGRHLPEEVNAVYIVTQHMAAQHRSMMAELVGHETRLPVVDIVDGMEPVANRIYVTPPNQDLVVEDGRLRLHEPSREPGAPKPSVNRFFHSLATEHGEHAIGIILSGTGADGAYGIEAIRKAGGVTIAQNESTARFDGMPNAAIGTGCVDLVMSPADIGAQFEQILQAPRDLESLQPDPRSRDDLSDLMLLLMARTQVDFRDYKAATVQRRIDRRMIALGISRLEDYVDHARSHVEEVDALFNDLLISVTAFFRDSGEFERLKDQLDERVGARKGRPEPLRIWVAACATGEEAYSMAILAAEAMGGFSKIGKKDVQVFATDIDEASVERARRGIYPEAALRDLPAEYRERYFCRIKDGYQVVDRLREAVMFSCHDVTRDPPFHNIDLVSCRNLLIYFRQSLQERIIARFHYALKDDGLLFLGKSESLAGSSCLFRTTGDDRRLFKKRSSIASPPLDTIDHREPFGHLRPIKGRKNEKPPDQTTSAMFDGLVCAVGPNCLLATQDLVLKQAYGDVSRYTALAGGDLEMTVAAVLRRDYEQEVRTLAIACQRRQEPCFGVVRVDESDVGRREQIRIYPIVDEPGNERMLLIVFAEWREGSRGEQAVEDTPESARQRIADLERALEVTQESLQQANEELQALNEQLQSSNEELQSINEELQSANEELTTVNEELQINTQEVNTLNQDLNSILINVGIPFLVVDRDLAVIRYSMEAHRYFKMDAGVTPPHVSFCRLPAGFPRLTDMIVEVLKTGKRLEHHVTGNAESANIAITPYQNASDHLAGVVVLISFTSELTRTQQELRLLLDNVPAGIMLRSKTGEILRVNQHAARILNMTADQLEGRFLRDFGVPEAIFREDREVIETGRPMLNAVHEITVPDGGSVWLRMDRVPFPNPETGEICVYSLAQDVTGIQAAEKALRVSQERLDLAVKGAGVGIWDWDLEQGTYYWSNRCHEILGLDADGSEGKPADFWDRLHPDDRERVKAARKAHLERCEPYDLIYRICKGDGSYRWIESRGQAIRDQNGKPTRFLGSADDITDRREEEIELRSKTGQLTMAEQLGGIGYWVVHLVENRLTWSDQVFTIHGETRESYTPDLESAIDYYHPDDRDLVRRCVEDGVAKGEPFDFEARIIRRSGEERIVRSTCRTEKDAAGRVIALFGIFSDITERHEQERERQATLDELSRSNAELSRFSYVCSHDLKEPVRTLGNMAELLLDEELVLDEDEKGDLLTRIHKNAQRLSGIIENLLAFSRIDGKLTIESVDLNEIVAEVRDALTAAIDDAEAVFYIARLPIIQGAKVHFRQLFQNLIGNALKFGPSGGCRIKVTCMDVGDAWMIAVDDDGPGVPTESRDEIFDVFARLKRADEIPGTGLGLSICKKILNQYRGSIHCDRSDLGGASMRMRLPKESS